MSTAESYKDLLLERKARVLIVKFNRPTRRNALSRRAYYEIIRVLQSVKHDATVAVVVFTGVGDIFTAGNDLSEAGAHAAAVSALSPNANEMVRKRLQLNLEANAVLRALVRTIVFFPKVLIALVNGVSIGMGFTLAALCDVVYCTENAYFEAPFTRLGLCPEMGSSYVFERSLGRSKASEVLMFGAKLSAEDALQFKFVSRVFKPQELEFQFWPKIMEYSMLPMESLKVSKQLIVGPTRQALRDAFEAECAFVKDMRLGEFHSNEIKKFLDSRKGNKSKL